MFSCCLKNVFIPSFPMIVSSSRDESNYHLYSSFFVPGIVQCTFRYIFSAKTRVPSIQLWTLHFKIFHRICSMNRAPVSMNTKVAALSGIRMAQWSLGPSESQRTRTFFQEVAYTARKKGTCRSLYPRQQHSLPRT